MSGRLVTFLTSSSAVLAQPQLFHAGARRSASDLASVLGGTGVSFVYRSDKRALVFRQPYCRTIPVGLVALGLSEWYSGTMPTVLRADHIGSSSILAIGMSHPTFTSSATTARRSIGLIPSGWSEVEGSPAGRFTGSRRSSRRTGSTCWIAGMSISTAETGRHGDWGVHHRRHADT